MDRACCLRPSTDPLCVPAQPGRSQFPKPSPSHLEDWEQPPGPAPGPPPVDHQCQLLSRDLN